MKTSQTTLELPFTSVDRLPQEVQGPFRALLEHGHSDPALAVLKTARTPAQLRNDYFLAVAGSSGLIIVAIAAGVGLSVSVSIISGLLVGVVALFCGVLAVWLWAGSRRALAKDPWWRCGLASGQYLVMRDEGTVRLLDLTGFRGARVEVVLTDGIQTDVALILEGPTAQRRWIGLDYFGQHAVARFAGQLNQLMEACAAAQQLPPRVAPQQLVQRSTLFAALTGLATGVPPAHPLWMSKGLHQGIRGAGWIDVCSDGVVRVRRFDPATGTDTVIVEGRAHPDGVRQLATTLADPQIEALRDLPAAPPSTSGETTIDISCGNERFHLTRPLHELSQPPLATVSAVFEQLKPPAS